MKEIISAVIFIVAIYGGTATLKAIHNDLRRAALEKAAQGLPSLSKMNKSLKNGKTAR